MLVNRLNIGSSVIVTLDDDTKIVNVHIEDSVAQTRAGVDRRLGSVVLTRSGIDLQTAQAIREELNDTQLIDLRSRKEAVEFIRTQVNQVLLERDQGVWENDE